MSYKNRLARHILLFPALGAVAILAGCGMANDDFVFRYAHSQSVNAPRSQSMVYFERELEQRSSGRVQVETYFSATLGNERELMDMVATGVLQGTRGGLFADANPKFVIFMLPFIVDDWEQAIRLVNSDLSQEINAGARDNGFYIPATGISQGFRAHTNSKRPIRHPDDLVGLKMRVPPQDIYVRTATAFGASPQEMPASDIYSALKTGVLDGQDNPPSNIWDYNIYEVQSFMTVTHYSTGPDPLIVNLEWYSALPSDLQAVFDAVSVDTIRYSDELNQSLEAGYITKLEEHLQIDVLTAEEIDAFRERVGVVYQHYVASGVITDEEIRRARTIAVGD
jgi:tripartite ATP-independent transporter DctP family solute receptor